VGKLLRKYVNLFILPIKFLINSLAIRLSALIDIRASRTVFLYIKHKSTILKRLYPTL